MPRHKLASREGSLVPTPLRPAPRSARDVTMQVAGRHQRRAWLSLCSLPSMGIYGLLTVYLKVRFVGSDATEILNLFVGRFRSSAQSANCAPNPTEFQTFLWAGFVQGPDPKIVRPVQTPSERRSVHHGPRVRTVLCSFVCGTQKIPGARPDACTVVTGQPLRWRSQLQH